MTSEDKAVAKIVAALSDRQVSPQMVGVILAHRVHYTDSAAEKEIITALISGIRSGP